MDVKKINKYIEMINEYVAEPNSVDKEWLELMYDVRAMLANYNISSFTVADSVSNNNNINIHLDCGAKMPSKAYETDAGFDLYSREEKTVKAHDSEIFDTGVHIELPKNTTGFIKSKSGLNVKHDIMSMGVIDVGYSGSIAVKLYNLGNKDYKVNKGDKISQLVILPIVNNGLIETVAINGGLRANNGFGSSGR